MRPDLNVAETIRFDGALEGAIGKADGLSGVAVIAHQHACEVVDVRAVGRLQWEDGEGVANVDEFRIILRDTGCGNGVTQSEVANGAECRGSAVGRGRSYVIHRLTVVGMRCGPVGAISVHR